jgi:hypothetical protein
MTKLCLEELEARTAPTVTAVNQSFLTTPQTPTSLEVLQQDNAASNEPVALLSVGAVAPSGPTLTQNADSSLTFASASTGTYTFPYTITGAQQAIFPGPYTYSGANNGVAVSGSTAVVGAQGAAYVYTSSGTGWTLQQVLTAPNNGITETTQFFGWSVAISGDTIVVGAYGQYVGNNPQGAAFVYTRSGTTWSLGQELTATDGTSGAGFGYSVAIETTTVVVGAAGQSGPSPTGAAYVYARSGTTWS